MSNETDVERLVTMAVGHMSSEALTAVWLAPATCQNAAWKRLVQEFSNPEMVSIFRARGVLDLILDKVDRHQWRKMLPAWPLLTVGELQRVLLRALRAHYRDLWSRNAHEMIEMMLERSDCSADDVFYIMQNAPRVRVRLFPALVSRGPALIHLIHCLGMSDIWGLALGEILKISDVGGEPSQWRDVLAGVERKCLTSQNLTELLVWQVERGILTREQLAGLVGQRGYTQAAKRALKKIDP